MVYKASEKVSPEKKHRLVVKIGSALLVDPENRMIRDTWLSSVCQDIAALRQQGHDLIIVSSGAISLARRQTDHVGKNLRLEEKQALASIGQVGLAQAWHRALASVGLPMAQLLLTQEDTEDRQRHLNARSCLNAILKLGTVPVINENDAIATEEIRFGDNDRLAARIAQMCGADRLVLLSDIDGLYTSDPRLDPKARHLPVIKMLDERIMAMGGAPPPGYSSGGMQTKLLAARIATCAGTEMVITNGQDLHPLKKLQQGQRHTLFLAMHDRISARKGWIASMVSSQGTFFLDAGAVHALGKGASLLAAGIVKIEGNFRRGDVVTLYGPDNTMLGRGLTEYDSTDTLRLLGHHSGEMEQILGYQGHPVLIHRDNLALDQH